MSVTAKELAKQLHLSEASVSIALNNKPGVSTATRKKILEAAKAAGYDFTKVKENVNPVSALRVRFILLSTGSTGQSSPIPPFSPSCPWGLMRAARNITII